MGWSLTESVLIWLLLSLHMYNILSFSVRVFKRYLLKTGTLTFVFFKGAIIERRALCRWGRRPRRHRDKERKDH